MSLRLRPVRIDDEAEALRANTELAVDGFDFLLDWDPDLRWGNYVERMGNIRRGRGLDEGRVPATFLFAEEDGELVGRVSIRHELNDFLRREGGHIGYAVRPGNRRRGFATEILQQALIIARAEGVDQVLVICHDDNVASAATIERCGGELADLGVDSDGHAIRRYWIR
jgi:predicted acetyltransferase